MLGILIVRLLTSMALALFVLLQRTKYPVFFQDFKVVRQRIKDKYRDLVKKYNDVVTENNKCRTVLAQTQDKALDRIAKLKREKKALGEKLRELEESRSTSSPSDISTLVADRVANEWKQRIDKVEEEWTERMNKVGTLLKIQLKLNDIEETSLQNDADHAIQLATTKADMHAALETKDKEIESWRSKCRTLEVQDGQANERWQKKVDELQQVIQALEAEKGDMIEKLSAAKLQGVKAVRDEEEKKREELVAEFSEKEQRLQQEFETRFRQFESSKEEEILQLKAEMESIRGVEGSLREAHVHETSLSNELERLRSELVALDETKQKEVAELKDSLTTAAEKHRAEIAELMQEHDEIVSSTRKQQLIELEAMTAKFELAREEADSLRLKNDTLEKQLDQLDETYTLERTQAEEALQKQIDELCEKLKSQETTHNSQSEAEMAGMRDSYSRLCESNDDLKRKLEEVTKVSVEQVAEAKQLEATLREELDELRAMLESRNSEFHLIEIRKQELEEEIATARELSAMHDRLKAELEVSTSSSFSLFLLLQIVSFGSLLEEVSLLFFKDTRKQRDEVECLVASLTERAERAEKALKEDRALLMEERSSLEKSVEERKEKDALISFSSESEFANKVNAHGNMASVSELSAQTAGEMCTSDEIQQLRSEIAYLNEMNTELTAKINHLEEENNTVKFTRDEAQRLLSELKTAGETVQGKLEVPARVGGSGDEPLGVSMSAGDVQLENIRLNEELKRNVEEIIVVRNHRAALEKELLELKSQLAERQSKADNAEVFVPLQDEDITEACGDKVSRSDDSHHRISQLEEELQVQLKEVDCLSQAAASERRRAEKALEEVNEKLAQQEALMNEIKQKDDVIAGLEEEVKRSLSDDSHHRISQLEEELQIQLKEVDCLSQAAASERRRAEKALEEVNEKLVQQEALMNEIKQKDDVIAELEEEVKRVSTEE
ncbi:M protein repeat protein, partial [Ostertagia ostertagi]